ncbi:MAG: biotin-dependent carboxyltransferase family protein [Woeseiaceae bacterium]|nr:biotin-dependent carboxyltransferase family protein [Woeseiaceae bacterium]
MTIRVVKSGVQTTVQARPRSGLRHLGVPASGPADPLSFALANRLAGNALDAAGLEITLWGAAFAFDTDALIGIAGAPCEVRRDGRRVDTHATILARAGQQLDIGPATAGARTYLAVAGGIAADTVLGSAATYLPAELGGYSGRALRGGDRLQICDPPGRPAPVTTPEEFRPPTGRAIALRACESAESGLLDDEARHRLFDCNFTVGARADRMGLQLDGARFETTVAGRLETAPVFPGTLQCPGDGRPFLLGIDAQTTGGYPRIAQVARVDRHLIGQLRPGGHVRFLRRSPEAARQDLDSMLRYWSRWLPGIEALL